MCSPFSFAAHPSKDKEEESLNQETKAKPHANAENKPGERMVKLVGFLMLPSSLLLARG